MPSTAEPDPKPAAPPDDALPPMVSFVAPSGTGKTALVEAVIGDLVARGLRVGAVKHDAHRIELDTEGKDSWRHRAAGAETLLVGANQVAWMSDDGRSPPLRDLVRLFFPTVDIVIVEGYRSAGLPTIRVRRAEVDDPTWTVPDPALVLATVHPDERSTTVDLLIGRFALNVRPE